MNRIALTVFGCRTTQHSALAACGPQPLPSRTVARPTPQIAILPEHSAGTDATGPGDSGPPGTGTGGTCTTPGRAHRRLGGAWQGSPRRAPGTRPRWRGAPEVRPPQPGTCGPGGLSSPTRPGRSGGRRRRPPGTVGRVAPPGTV